MKKVALVFALAVFVPSLVLGWLALRSVRDQQTVVERQQALLCQGVADALAKEVQDFMSERQHDFAQQVEALLTGRAPREVATHFDERLRRAWPLAEIGFAVSLDGDVLCPSLLGGPAACAFRLENDRFFCCDTVEVYWNSPKGPIKLSQLSERSGASDGKEPDKKTDTGIFATKSKSAASTRESATETKAPSEAEFRQLIGDSYEGTLARFLQNKLKLLLWYRSLRDAHLVFGAQLDLKQLNTGLRELIHAPDALRGEIAVALLDDNAKPVAGQAHGTQAPFVISGIGETLPHWAVALYLQNPDRMTRSAQTLKLTLTLIIALLVLAILVGGMLVVSDVKRQLALARQKTDFVSNVSHELKTPLTSIRMFSELLAEEKVHDAPRRRQFLGILTAETARLTRLINNVLDFSRLERGEQKYRFAECDLGRLARETIEAYRPHLESNGFKLDCRLTAETMLVQGDPDALAQVLVNLVSNAEKYSGERKEILVQSRVISPSSPTPGAGAPPPASAAGGDRVEIQILDRGVGVPRDCEDRIFEQFYRAHDSLASGIQGSGLGLTLARQIARAHGGDVVFAPREGGGSCFILALPGIRAATPDEAGSGRTEGKHQR